MLQAELSKQRAELNTKIDREREKIAKNYSKFAIKDLVEREMSLEKQNHELNRVLNAKLTKPSPRPGEQSGINFSQKGEQNEPIYLLAKGLSPKVKDALVSSLKKDSILSMTAQDPRKLSQSIYLRKPSHLKTESHVNESQIHFSEGICEQSNLRNSQRFDDKSVLVLNSKVRTHSQILNLLKVDSSRKLFQDKSNYLPFDFERSKEAEQLDRKLPQITGQNIFKIPRRQF